MKDEVMGENLGAVWDELKGAVSVLLDALKVELWVCPMAVAMAAVKVLEKDELLATLLVSSKVTRLGLRCDIHYCTRLNRKLKVQQTR